MSKRYPIGASRIAIRTSLVASLMLATTACVSQIPPVKDWADRTVGSPISILLESARRPGSYVARTGSQIRQYRLEGGNSVYVEPIREGCAVHWEVNSSGVVVGYRTEGDRCY